MTVYIVDLEAVETRYTAQWKQYLPLQIKSSGLDVKVISGGEVPQATTPGAFLNFAGTNSYKSQQLLQIAEMFANGTVKDGDYFLYTDAWNPTVIQLKYMAKLLGVNIKIGGMWHAGSYDPQDFLGRLIGDECWVRNAESSMFYCYDQNFFATRFHVNLMAKNLWGLETFIENDEDQEYMYDHDERIRIVGWPMEYLDYLLADYTDVAKKNKIIFPHRLAPEKQLDMFKELAAEMPEYEWFVAQEHNLTKHEYHTHLAESRMVFSANLQETLGISMYEGMIVGAYPMVPDRLSYSEMYKDMCYDSSWTENMESFRANKDKLVTYIRNIMNSNNSDVMSAYIQEVGHEVGDKFFCGKALYKEIIDSMT